MCQKCGDSERGGVRWAGGGGGEGGHWGGGQGVYQKRYCLVLIEDENGTYTF